MRNTGGYRKIFFYPDQDPALEIILEQYPSQDSIFKAVLLIRIEMLLLLMLIFFLTHLLLIGEGCSG